MGTSTSTSRPLNGYLRRHATTRKGTAQSPNIDAIPGRLRRRPTRPSTIRTATTPAPQSDSGLPTNADHRPQSQSIVNPSVGRFGRSPGAQYASSSPFLASARNVTR